MALDVEKTKRLIDKHQEKANQYHEVAKTHYANGLKAFTVQADQKAHWHESRAVELRLLIHE